MSVSRVVDGSDGSDGVETTLLSWSGDTMFGEPNATLTGEQMRAGAYPAGSMADPVNTATGELYETYTDVALPSYGGTAALVRTYASNDTVGGLLGPGWRTTLETSLRGDLGGTGDGSVVHTTGAGAQVTYKRQPDGSYTTPPAATDELAATPAGFELTSTAGSKLQFNGSGRLTGAVSDDGQTTAIGYDTGGLLDTVTAPNGRALDLTVTATGNGPRLTGVTTFDGRTVSYGYDTAGRLTTFTDLRGKVWNYRYDTAGRLDRETDPQGHHRHTTTYDTDGRVVEQVDANGGITTFEWGMTGGDGWVTMTDPEGNQYTDFYLGYVTVARYAPDGRRTSYHYDTAARITQIDQPDGSTTTFTYDTEGRPTHTTHTPPVQVDNAGQQLAEQPAPRTAETVYDADGNVTATIDAAGRQTAYSYDSAGRVVEVTHPDGVTTVTAYDTRGLPTQTTVGTAPGTQLTTGYTYDPATGDLLTTTDPNGATTSWQRDAAGRAVKVVPPAGNVTGADADLYASTFTFDDAGLVLTATDALARTVTNVYDDAGRLTATTDAGGRTLTYTYDAAGNATHVQGPEPAKPPIVTSYDGLGRPVTVTDPAGRSASRSYDAAGRVTTVTDPSGTAKLTYNDAGKVASTVDQAGRTTTFTYDPFGQTTGIRYADGATVAYAYDDRGRLATVTDATGTTGYTYDAADRPSTITTPAGTFTYTYDDLGRLTSRQRPDGTVEQTVFNGALVDQVTVDTVPVATYSYDTTGTPNAVTLANGVTEARSYDTVGRIATIEARDSANALVHEAAYSYDVLGRPVHIDDEQSEQAFTYDLADRLTRVCFGSTVCDGTETDYIAYSYDVAGRRATETRPGATRTYDYDTADRLLTVHADDGTGPVLETDFAYDAVGNTTRAGTSTFAWNPAGKLTSATVNGTTSTYTYDHRGLRTRAQDPAATATTSWDPVSGSQISTATTDGTTTSVTNYLPHSQDVDGTRSYLHNDATSTLQAITDAAGATVASYDYEPFGAIRTVRDATGQTVTDGTGDETSTVGFHGHHHDPTGLVYMQARYYDPITGRFLSPDPAGGSYTYGFNNPVMFVDPDGLWAWSAVGEHASTVSTVAGFVVVGVVVGALIIGAPLGAPLVAGALWTSGAVAFGADVIDAAHTCGAGKGGCGSSIAMAGVGAVGGGSARAIRAAARRTALPLAPEAVTGGGGRLLWGSWNDYPKVTVGGREYAQIGDRLYSHHAVDRLQPSGLGAPAGATGAGRSISPTYVEDVISGSRGVPVKGPNGEPRLSFTSGSVQVITENGIVVTVITR